MKSKLVILFLTAALLGVFVAPVQADASPRQASKIERLIFEPLQPFVVAP